MTSLEILTGIKNWVDNRIPYSPYIPPASLIFEEDGIYQVKDGSVYPIGHPDLSTQPSTLYQRFGNLDIQEVLIAPGRENEIPNDALIIHAFSFNPSICVPAICKHGLIADSNKAYADFMLPISLNDLIGYTMVFHTSGVFDKDRVAFMLEYTGVPIRATINLYNGAYYLTDTEKLYNKVYISGSTLSFDDSIASLTGYRVTDILYDDISVFRTGWEIRNDENIVPSYTLIQYVGARSNPYSDPYSDDYDEDYDGYDDEYDEEYEEPYEDQYDEIDDVDDGQLVDLGLPSGTLWAKSNLGASKPSGNGLFYQWGEVDGYNGTSIDAFTADTYDWYDTDTQQYTKYTDDDHKVRLDLTDDPVYIASQGDLIMPTSSDFTELKNHTYQQYITIAGGQRGIKFINKHDSSKYIFIPCSGYLKDRNHLRHNYRAYLWSRTLYTQYKVDAFGMEIIHDEESVAPNYIEYRYTGFNIRGVKHPDDEYYGGDDPLVPTIDDTDDGTLVDLGLPSGNLWAKSNLGATKPSDFGLYYAWGELQGYEDANGAKTFSLSDYTLADSNGFTKYNNTDGKTVLDSTDDAAYVASSGERRMPRVTELQELYNNTDHEWITLANGVSGMKFINKTDYTKYIFIPGAVFCSNGDSYGEYNDGIFLWSSDLNDSFDSCTIAFNFKYDMENPSDPKYGTPGVSRYHGLSIRAMWSPEDEYYGGDDPLTPGIDDVDDGTFVDLGLPSGTKWAKSNLGASKPSDFGNYYAWGETVGYANASGTKEFSGFDYSLYDRDSATYTKYNSVDNKFTLDHSDDAAYVASGGISKMPTLAQCAELHQYTDQVYLTLPNGVDVIKFINKSDYTKYIAIPCAGYAEDGEVITLVNSHPLYRIWTSDRDSSDAWARDQYAVITSDNQISFSDYSTYRYRGLSIRPVQNEDGGDEGYDEDYYESGYDPIDPTIDDTDDGTYVDLGLPSGTLWAKSNVGAAMPSGYGSYYQWALSTTPSDALYWTSSSYTWNDCPYATISDGDVTFSKYNVADQKKTLEWEDDAILRNRADGSNIPTKALYEELVANTYSAFISLPNGRYGIKFVNKSDPTKYIFIPAAGVATSGSVVADGNSILMWTSNLDDVGVSPDTYNTTRKYAFAFAGNSIGTEIITDERSYGCSLRPVKTVTT